MRSTVAKAMVMKKRKVEYGVLKGSSRKVRSVVDLGSKHRYEGWFPSREAECILASAAERCTVDSIGIAV